MVTNTSEEDWTDINVAPFIAQEPITTRDELAEAADTAPDVTVGDRLTDPGTYVSVGDLAPGRSAPFTIRIPVTSLLISGDPGVYWIGVHALGTSPDGRDLIADGRARTFIPLVTPDVARATHGPGLRRTPPAGPRPPGADGSLNGPARWVGLTSSNGRLRRLVEFGASAGNAPVSWLVDPAVLDALNDFARGNPPLSLGPPATRAATDDGDTAATNPASSRAGRSSQESSEGPPRPEPRTGPGAPTQRARAERGRSSRRSCPRRATDPLLTLGYADPDVVSLARRRPSLNDRAVDLAARRLQARGLTARRRWHRPTATSTPSCSPRCPRTR